MRISYRETLPEREQFFELFQTTGWNKEYRLEADEIHEALKHTWYAVCAYDGGRLVGYGRVLSDGKLHALIVEMIVLPSYQGKGIGSAILEKMMERCLAHKIRDIQLFCAKGKAGFYERYGFFPRPEVAPGMQYPVEKVLEHSLGGGKFGTDRFLG